MAESYATRAAEKREKVESYEQDIAAVEAFKAEIKSAETLGETALSGLFHEARTNKKSVWSGATAFCDIVDGEVVVDDVRKIREGDWTPETRERYDMLLTLPVRPFMETDICKSFIRDNLEQKLLSLRETAHSYRRAAEDLEQLAEGNK